MEEKKQVEFKYKFSSDYKVYSVTGLQGSITPAGDLVINCYQERHSIPESESYEILENGQLKLIKTEGESANTIIRDVPFAISISPVQARVFANWLNAKADEYEKRTVNVPDKLDG